MNNAQIPILSLNDNEIISSSQNSHSPSSPSNSQHYSSNSPYDASKNSKNQIMSNLYIPSSVRSEWDEYSITQSPAFVVLKEMFSDSMEDDEGVPTSYVKSASLESFTECVESADMDDSTTSCENQNMMESVEENSVTASTENAALKSQNSELLNSPSRKQSICESPRNSHRNSIISLPICKEIDPKDIKLNILHLKKKARHIRILLVRHGQCVTNVHKTILQEKSDHSIPLSKAGEEQAKAAGVYIKRFYEDMNKRLWEKIQKENLKYTDISKKKFLRELKFVSNETTDFKFDNELSEDEEEEEPLENITYPLRVRMWNSTYNRARDTANIIMSEASNVIQDQRESILLVEQQFGLFEGVPLEELNKRFPQEFQHFEKHIGFFGRFYARPPLGESRFDVSKRVKLLFEKLISDSETEGINDVIIVSHGVTVRAFTQMNMSHTSFGQLTRTDNFKQAINAANNEYSHSKEWNSYKANLGYSFPAPACSITANTAVYPETFNWNSTELILCYEMEAVSPWPQIHEMAGQFLVNTLKSHYNLYNLTATFLIINTTKLGYFPSLKNAIENGSCHVAIASTNFEASRALEVDFQCPYGTSFTGVLRSELDNSTYPFTSISDLNKQGIIIAAPYQTTFYDFAKLNYPKATILSNFGFKTAYNMILNKQVHAVVGDYIDMNEWLVKVRENCTTCAVKISDTSQDFGSFIAKVITSGAMVGRSLSSLFVLVFIMIWILC